METRSFQLFLVVAVFVNLYIFLFNNFASKFQINGVAQSRGVDVNASNSVTKINVYGEKIDWHDYKFMLVESQRKGPGQQGAPFYLTDTAEIDHNERELAEEGFAVVVSDHIPPDRSLPDVRLET